MAVKLHSGVVKSKHNLLPLTAGNSKSFLASSKLKGSTPACNNSIMLVPLPTRASTSTTKTTRNKKGHRFLLEPKIRPAMTALDCIVRDGPVSCVDEWVITNACFFCPFQYLQICTELQEYQNAPMDSGSYPLCSSVCLYVHVVTQPLRLFVRMS